MRKSGSVVGVYIEDEVRRSFLDYAMSVIVARALPDVRDGLKPVQRRILYTMHEMGLMPNRPFRKSAAVVGDVLGKYHPHGDTAVYDAMVRMAQDFSLRYPLVNGQGNFGSIDGDAPAAYRYTETKLKPLASELLADMNRDTVDFKPNFDERLKEPEVLPASFPNLLANGAAGIAVGMATNIPPHNLSELIDGLVALIDDPEIEPKGLMKYIHGPDFPTGATIVGIEGIHQAYETGRGKIIMRGKARFEEVKAGRDRLIITEIPYQVNKTSLIERIAYLAREKKIQGVADMRDESDREGMRIVLDLKRDTNKGLILNQLYKYTDLQCTFGIILLVLVHGEPKVLNLLELLKEFLKFRVETITRRTKFDLTKAEDRAHVLEGLKIALKHINAVIELIKRAKDTETARDGLMKQFKLSKRQAEAILEMKLGRLTNLERSKIDEEYKGLIKEIARLKSLLGSRRMMMAEIRAELLEIKKKYGDERRTEIIRGQVENFSIEDLIEEEDMAVTVTHRGYIKRMPVSVYRRQGRGGTGRSGMAVRDEDFVEGLFIASTHDYMMFFTNRGRCYCLKVYEIPEGSYTARGRSSANLVEMDKSEVTRSYLAVREFSEDRFVFFVTRQGKVKRTSLSAFSNPRRKGIIAMKIGSKDELVGTMLTSGKDEIIIVTRNGMGIRFKEKDVRCMGRAAAGVRGIRLRKGDCVIGCVVCRPERSLLVISEKGLGKRTEFDKFPIRHRGGFGVIAAKLLDRSGKLAAAISVTNSSEVIITTRHGAVIRIKMADVKKLGRATTGVKLMEVKKGDVAVDVAKVETQSQN
ncbi:DNA gyrase subunit A [candidate division WOR-3 bacterium JGI_Cruoil_03_51_56]|uniref:DNA gyrase subunit A n=1 Tax=candidate division WOR-3 bacterium JGI_Cruoil_03_51_56 TaxID=1973747 RepID=A0A235BRK1_UNCW3|nr:MAG: DNA gyrase subunit A [candidate division WOR-3 bacterium JGI_Cruoil_03_51_56]